MEKKVVSAIMLILLLVISMLTLVYNIQPVKASGTIYIKADGSVDPSDAPISSPDSIMYTFTNNVYEEIEVRRSNITIDGNGYIIQGTGAYDSSGIELGIVSNVTIKNVEIRAFYSGIEVYESSNNSIHSSNIKNTTTGILFWGTWEYSNFNSVFGNNLTDNFCGIHMSMASNNNISENNITNNDCGIFISAGSNNTIYQNNIKDNSDFGIRLISSGNYINHNDFINNAEQVARRGESSTNYWDDGYPSGGNYWSDYTGEDDDGDGIGDTTYDIDEDNRDRYPLMSPWGEIPLEEVFPFWMQWWLWAIVAVVIVALAGAVYLKKRQAPTTPIPPPESTEQSE